MQISSISISTSLPMEKTKSSAPAQSTTDTPVMSFSSSASSFTNLVKQASQMPEVRSDVVDSFKSRIQAGQYPDSETVDNLTDVIGSSIVKMANSSSDDE